MEGVGAAVHGEVLAAVHGDHDVFDLDAAGIFKGKAVADYAAS